MTVETVEFIKQLHNGKAAIYGTGYVAGLFWHALEKYDLTDRICCFAVSQPVIGQYHGLPVITGEELAANFDCPVLLAVHKSIATELAELLGDRAIWVYPYLHEMIFGETLQENIRIPCKTLLQKQDKQNNWITFRYMAAKEYMEGHHGSAEDIYIECMSAHCGMQTALKRFAMMQELADDIKTNGWNDHYPVLIDENGRVIDGLHRIACACAAGIQTITCNVVAASDDFEVVFDDTNRLPDYMLDRLGINEEQMHSLATAKTELIDIASEAPEISAIVPVYNIGEYLDICMETIRDQTFPDMEILLINDGSTDDSAKRCREWARRDLRIRFIDKENEGVAASRNLGVSMARGKYIAFIDPDDWLDLTYMEKLHNALETSGACFAECDLWRYNSRTGKKIYRKCGSRAGLPYTFREHMKYGPTATYKSMSRRGLWTKYEIRMPDVSFESPAIYALVLALSRKVVSVEEPLYYYRRFRENSLIETGYASKDGKPDLALGISAMEYLIEQFKRCGIYDEFSDTLEGVVKYRLSDILAMQFHRRSPEEFREIVSNYRSFLSRMFPEGLNGTYVTWGGYNLSRILIHMDWLHDPSCRFSFSSFISVTGDHASDCGPFRHKNKYREIMLERERTCMIWDTLERTRPDYLFIDLIEERFDVVLYKGRYYTASDAWEGRITNDIDSIDVEKIENVPRSNIAATELWKRAAERFVQRLRELSPTTQIVIVENYLSVRHGDVHGQQEFIDADSIRRQNDILRTYYKYLERLCPEALVVRPSEDRLYFTDDRYEYGAIPSHLNEVVNQKIAEKIQAVLREKQ